ncbi:MAG: transcriptional repressor [Planctomycetota bacterium]|nr:transcriptional repressor [Planctomycetota bacterium]MEC9232462.1 transcriptional repressor [Planctomycetota bacterium]
MPERRTTRQLNAIRGVIVEAGRPLSIPEIHELALASVSTLGLRTVYRAVRKLEESGELTAVAVPGGADRYELSSVAAQHHHHFHCTACDRYFDIHGCPGGLSKLLPEGFTLHHHELTLSGLCDACQ